jgi:hypothetical protein
MMSGFAPIAPQCLKQVTAIAKTTGTPATKAALI